MRDFIAELGFGHSIGPNIGRLLDVIISGDDAILHLQRCHWTSMGRVESNKSGIPASAEKAPSNPEETRFHCHELSRCENKISDIDLFQLMPTNEAESTLASDFCQLLALKP